MPAEAALTIAVSSRRLGAKMPGVSTNMTWQRSRIVMPMTRRRVVCTLGETIETLVPTSRLSRVDLPTLGAPMIATKPARVAEAQPCGTCAIRCSIRPAAVLSAPRLVAPGR